MGSRAAFAVASALYVVGFCFLGPLFFPRHLGDHSPDASPLAEDGLEDSNPVAADLGLIFLMILRPVISWLVPLLSQEPNQLAILYEFFY
jgi:hypothetical protein